MNQPVENQTKSGAVSLAQSSPTVGTFRERDGGLEWSGRQETVLIEPWGPDAVRVRARLGGSSKGSPARSSTSRGRPRAPSRSRTARAG